MAYLNKTLLIGNLTRDPELRVTPKGTSICSFGMALSRKFKSEAGEEKEEVTFLNLEAWGKTGELISKYCTKGSPLMVEGRLKLDQWDDKQTGQKRSAVKVVVESMQFLGSRKDGQGAAAGRDPQAPDEQQRGQHHRESAGIDEDVPF